MRIEAYWMAAMSLLLVLLQHRRLVWEARLLCRTYRAFFMLPVCRLLFFFILCLSYDSVSSVSPSSSLRAFIFILVYFYVIVFFLDAFLACFSFFVFCFVVFVVFLWVFVLEYHSGLC